MRCIIEERDVPLMVVVLGIMHQYVVLSPRYVDPSFLVRLACVIIALEYLRFVKT